MLLVIFVANLVAVAYGFREAEFYWKEATAYVLLTVGGLLSILLLPGLGTGIGFTVMVLVSITILFRLGLQNIQA